jgi:hypothetical protein
MSDEVLMKVTFTAEAEVTKAADIEAADKAAQEENEDER